MDFKLKSILMLFLYFSLFYNLQGKAIINEIMPAPEGDEPEWIEIYNTENRFIEYNEIFISDLKTVKEISFTIDAYQYIILTPDKDLFLKSRNVPEEAKVIKFPLPGLNNTSDAVVLKNAKGEIIDSSYYDMNNGKKGFSFERILTNEPAYGNNLKVSISTDKATPGYLNSISPKDKDLILKDFYLFDKLIKAVIINAGSDDANFDFNIKSDDELIFEQNDIDIKSGDTNIINSNKLNITGNIELTCEVVFEADRDKSNNILIKSLNFPQNKQTIIINEILFDNSDNNSEFIELYNKSDSSVNLKDYSFHDEAALDKSGVILEEDVFIESNGYLVIAWDSLIFEKYQYLINFNNTLIPDKSVNLNSTGDYIELRTSSGSVMDSLSYSKDWHNSSLLSTKDISLEKLSPNLESDKIDSWASSVDINGATPGKENSVMININNDAKIDISPNPFSPYSNKNISECYIKYNYKFRDASITAKIYDISGAELRVIKNNENSTGSGVIKWDGKNDEGFILPPGPYVLIFQIKNNINDKIYSVKKAVVIGN